MTSIALDTNVFLYAELEPQTAKGALAEQIVEACSGRAIVAAQVLGEFLSVVRRRTPDAMGDALLQVADYRAVFTIVPTSAELIGDAGTFSDRYQVQFWDALIWQASLKGGASVLLTEDMQDGFAALGLRALNPFAVGDWSKLEAMLNLAP